MIVEGKRCGGYSKWEGREEEDGLMECPLWEKSIGQSTSCFIRTFAKAHFR